MSDLTEFLPFGWYLQRAKDLRRNHGCKVDGRVNVGKRMVGRRDRDEFQIAFDASYHHHLACYEIERHAQKGRVARFQAQKVAGDASRGKHSAFLHKH